MDPKTLQPLAEVIPKEGWNKLIATACSTFSELVTPITKTTAGLGGLIQAKFDGMIDAQKVFAADAVAKAREKVERTNRPSNHRPKARVLIPAIEHASLESDDDLREIWSNLIANEMLEGSVHPEFPSILARFGTNDALTLSHFAEQERLKLEKEKATILERLVRSLKNAFGGSEAINSFTPRDFDLEHLEHLGLLQRVETLSLQSGIISPKAVRYELSSFGRGFIEAVVDPNDQST